ncbi:MAG: cytochrome c oxidase subunit II [Chloroflexi bacterium]|nr:cytochrome c oxidase subunit II [Chloroflexota bacterium]
MKRHLVITAIIWAILTAIGEAGALANLYPTVGSSEAKDFDDIFKLLLYMGIPVFTFVIAVLIYSMLEFRTRGEGAPDSDGPPYKGTGMVPKVWILVTGVLAIVVMINPGLTGLAKLQDDKTGYGWGSVEADIVIRVTGQQFSWNYEYLDEAGEVEATVLPLPNNEIVIPNHSKVKFEINSVDVLHSFWIPAFRMKIDAVPGRTTFITVEPNVLGDYETDTAYRVQCAELCGLNHADMRTRVRVVSEDDYKSWLESKKAGGK